MAAESEDTKRRREKRYPYITGLPCRILSWPSAKPSDAAKDELTAESIDINEHGVGISIPGMMLIGTIMKIQLPGTSENPSVQLIKARVVWCKSYDGKVFRAGVEFVSLTPAKQLLVHNLVQTLVSQQKTS